MFNPTVNGYRKHKSGASVQRIQGLVQCGYGLREQVRGLVHGCG